MIGIYKITNLVNGKCYIGQSRNIDQRWKNHKKSKLDYPLYKAFKKYGIENFKFEILEECKVEELNEKELYYIKKYDSSVKGYNQTVEIGNQAHSSKLSTEKIQELKKDLKTTNLNQNELAKKYEINERTVRDINSGRMWVEENEKYPIRKYWISETGVKTRANDPEGHPYKYKEEICPNCGGIKSKTSSLCKNCYNKELESNSRYPSNAILIKEIHEKGIEKTAKYYKVSCCALTKHLKKMGMPYHQKSINDLYEKAIKSQNYVNTINNFKRNDKEEVSKRKRVDKKKIVKILKKYKSIKETANITKNCPKTIRKIAKEFNLNWDDSKENKLKKVKCERCEFEKMNRTFKSVKEAAVWILANNIENNKGIKDVEKNIRKCCLKYTKTSYGFKWSYIEN